MDDNRGFESVKGNMEPLYRKIADGIAEEQRRGSDVRRSGEGPFSADEYRKLRQLVTDRIEDRFRAAAKAAEMSVKALTGITKEIGELDALWEKLMKLGEQA